MPGHAFTRLRDFISTAMHRMLIDEGGKARVSEMAQTFWRRIRLNSITIARLRSAAWCSAAPGAGSSTFRTARIQPELNAMWALSAKVRTALAS
jgi:hypothetical protein